MRRGKTSTDAPSTDQSADASPSRERCFVDIGATARCDLRRESSMVASNLSVSTNENTLLSGQVSATDADGDHLTYSVVAGASHGSVALQSGGSFTYTPPAFYSGTDSFTFEAFDGQAYSNIATVSITVSAVNLPKVENIPFITVADGTVADRNLDGTYDAVDTTSSSITDRWFTDPTIGQERGVFEFNLSRIAPGTPILSATIALDITSLTSSSVGGVTTDPQINFVAATGTGSVTTADGGSMAASAGTGTVSSLGYEVFTLTGAALQSLEGGFAVIRIQNSALSAPWFSVASLENTLGQPAMLSLQIASTPIVALSIKPGTVVETAGANAATAVLTRNGDLSTPLTVSLSSNNTSQLTVPSSETFAAGSSSLSFGVNAVDNHVHDQWQQHERWSSATPPPSSPTRFCLDWTLGFGVDGLAATSLSNHDWFPQAALARQSDGKILAASEYSADTWRNSPGLSQDGSARHFVRRQRCGTGHIHDHLLVGPGTIPRLDAIAVQPGMEVFWLEARSSKAMATPAAACRFNCASGQVWTKPSARRRIRRPERIRDSECSNSRHGHRLAGPADGGSSSGRHMEQRGGFFSRPSEASLLPNGTIDSSLFTVCRPSAPDITQAVALLPNGQFLPGGPQLRVARFNADGTLDLDDVQRDERIHRCRQLRPAPSLLYPVSPSTRRAASSGVAGDCQFSSNGPTRWLLRPPHVERRVRHQLLAAVDRP